MGEEIPSRLCGWPFDEADLERIRREIVRANPPLRAEIARRVCRALHWTDGHGRPKLMSARVGLLRLHRAGLIDLPAPSRGNGNGRGLLQGPDRWPEPVPVGGTVGQLSGLRLEAVREQRASRLWNGLIERVRGSKTSILRGESPCSTNCPFRWVGWVRVVAAMQWLNLPRQCAEKA